MWLLTVEIPPFPKPGKGGAASVVVVVQEVGQPARELSFLAVQVLTGRASRQLDI
jgi:hypothetical protein